MQKLIMTIGAAAVAVGANASSITIDSVQQRWPWNNKVDITYTVTDGQNYEAGVYAGVDFTVSIPGRGSFTLPGPSAETGGTGSRQHSFASTFPSGIKATDCTITATLFPTNVPLNDYMIIDLASGAVSYERLLATQEDSNARYNTTEYKTSKMVLRKVPKWSDASTLPNYSEIAALGGYPTGHSDFNSVSGGSAARTSPGKNSRAYRQPDKDYYLSIFKVTIGQFETVTGGSDTSNTKCKQGAGYHALRNGGTATDYTYAASTNAIAINASGTFFQRLNYRTGLYLDYPTEVMHEIAARAGATTVYIWGDTADDYADYAVDVNSGKTQYVATKKPNAWGFYDMCGLGLDFCLGSLRNNVASGRPNLSSQGVFVPSTDASSRAPDAFPIKGGGSYTESIANSSILFKASFRGVCYYNQAGTSYRVAYIVK